MAKVSPRKRQTCKFNIQPSFPSSDASDCHTQAEASLDGNGDINHAGDCYESASIATWRAYSRHGEDKQGIGLRNLTGPRSRKPAHGYLNLQFLPLSPLRSNGHTADIHTCIKCQQESNMLSTRGSGGAFRLCPRGTAAGRARAGQFFRYARTRQSEEYSIDINGFPSTAHSRTFWK